MPFVVAAPAALVGATGAFWYLLTVLFGLEPSDAARFMSGVVFGLGGFALLAASSSAPVNRIAPPPWRRSILLGLLCTVALWLVSLAAFTDWNVAFIVGLGGLSCLAADRRTTASLRARTFHRALLVLTMLVAAERVISVLFIEDDPYVGLGILCALLVAVFLPIARLQRWAMGLLPAANHGSEKTKDIEGYRNEVLALAAFLESDDIPKSLVVTAAQEAGAGRASSLRTLAATAIRESGVDSLRVDVMAQEFARQRMLPDERKAWAARAVRMLAEAFPDDDRDPLCDRLVPHALSATDHAEELDVARGAAAVLLDRVGAYMVASGRSDEARKITVLAVPHATTAFGGSSSEVTRLHGRLAALQEPQNETIDMSLVDVPFIEIPDAGDRAGLAFHFATLGDARREAGDNGGARRHYTTALAHARYALGRRHPLNADLRSRIDALPGVTTSESEERRLILGCFTLVMAAVLICVGAVAVRYLGEGRMRASGDPLAEVGQLSSMCTDNPRYFPDAAPFGGSEPHPVRVFRRTNSDGSYRAEPYQVVNAPAQSTQLVGCLTQDHTGPRVATCAYPDRPEIPLHQATYLLTVFEARTGEQLGTQTITATQGVCPATYEPPGEGKRWMLYAAPADDQYRQAMVPIEDLLTTRPSKVLN